MKTFARWMILGAVVGMIMLSAAMRANAGPSIQLEAGVSEQKNPIDDQYVLEHAGPGYTYGMQYTSPAYGIAIREDAGPLVVVAGWRDLGHQRIDTDILPDSDYFKCRFHNNCGPKIERWYTRMTTSEAYATIGWKFHVGAVSVIPNVGWSMVRDQTSVQVCFPYAYAWKNKQHQWTHADIWYEGDHQNQPHTTLGLDLEYGNVGVGVEYLPLNTLPTQMGDPGQGPHSILTRITYRFDL